jgi:hypothetical protein
LKKIEISKGHENDENKMKNSSAMKSSQKIDSNSTEKNKKFSTKPTQSSKITSFFTKK